MINSDICMSIIEEFICELNRQIDKRLLEDEVSSLSRSEIKQCISISEDKFKGVDLYVNKQQTEG